MRFQQKPQEIQFTKDGYQKLKTDFAVLSEKRKEVLIRLQIAREMGDLSENGAYRAAKFELGSIDRQLRKLTYLIRFGKIIETKNDGVINFGSRITLYDGEKKLVFTLVGGYESDPSQKKLSTYSPVGKAVVGKKVNDKITVSLPLGSKEYTIIKVE